MGEWLVISPPHRRIRSISFLFSTGCTRELVLSLLHSLFSSSHEMMRMKRHKLQTQFTERQWWSPSPSSLWKWYFHAPQVQREEKHLFIYFSCSQGELLFFHKFCQRIITKTNYCFCKISGSESTINRTYIRSDVNAYASENNCQLNDDGDYWRKDNFLSMSRDGSDNEHYICSDYKLMITIDNLFTHSHEFTCVKVTRGCSQSIKR